MTVPAQAEQPVAGSMYRRIGAALFLRGSVVVV